jgi:hypothetical protein
MSDRCPICCQPAAAPYRRHDARGVIFEGCVASFHTGHLVPMSESARWHNRPESKRCRAAMKRGAK